MGALKKDYSQYLGLAAATVQIASFARIMFGLRGQTTLILLSASAVLSVFYISSRARRNSRPEVILGVVLLCFSSFGMCADLGFF
jgi:hypothetical protein